eukprot:14631633-Alexandrium_andersonii.AAC.1
MCARGAKCQAWCGHGTRRPSLKQRLPERAPRCGREPGRLIAMLLWPACRARLWHSGFDSAGARAGIAAQWL